MTLKRVVTQLIRQVSCGLPEVTAHAPLSNSPGLSLIHPSSTCVVNMADVELQREEEGEKAAPEESLLNGEAGEKDEVDPSEETAKKRRKKKKKKSAALAGKLERPRAACIRSNAGAYSSYTTV